MSTKKPKRGVSFYAVLACSRALMRDFDGFTKFIDFEMPVEFPGAANICSQIREPIFATELLRKPTIEDVVQYRHCMKGCIDIAGQMLAKIESLDASEQTAYAKDVLGGIIAAGEFLDGAIESLLEWHGRQMAAAKNN